MEPIIEDKTTAQKAYFSHPMRLSLSPTTLFRTFRVLLIQDFRVLLIQKTSPFSDPLPRHSFFVFIIFFLLYSILGLPLTSDTPKHMESVGNRHGRSASSSSDRLLGVFAFSPPSNSSFEDELTEAELFWTGGDTPESNPQPSDDENHNGNTSFSQPKKSGILAVLPEFDKRFPDGPVFYRKPSISSSSSSKMIPPIPRPPPGLNLQNREYFSHSAPSKRFQQSAPMNVPVLSTKAWQQNEELTIIDDDLENDDEILPPHELLARGSGVSPRTTFSVLEGVGRTLKGRDLRQVRNAVWRKTGFLD